MAQRTLSGLAQVLPALPPGGLSPNPTHTLCLAEETLVPGRSFRETANPPHLRRPVPPRPLGLPPPVPGSRREREAPRRQARPEARDPRSPLENFRASALDCRGAGGQDRASGMGSRLRKGTLRPGGGPLSTTARRRRWPLSSTTKRPRWGRNGRAPGPSTPRPRRAPGWSSTTRVPPPSCGSRLRQGSPPPKSPATRNSISMATRRSKPSGSAEGSAPKTGLAYSGALFAGASLRPLRFRSPPGAGRYTAQGGAP